MRLLIIESDPIWQLKISMMLAHLPGLSIEIAETCKAAALSLTQVAPDIVLTDISLTDGIAFDLFKNSPPTYPIVFFTEFPEDDHFWQALSLPNTTFLVKPFHRFTLQGAIQSLINRIQILPKPALMPVPKAGIRVSGKYRQKILLSFNEITYIEGERNYVTLHTISENRYVLKTSLRKILHELDTQFIQIQKGFILNRNFIHKINISAGTVNVKGHLLPIGRMYQKDLLSLIN